MEEHSATAMASLHDTNPEAQSAAESAAESTTATTPVKPNTWAQWDTTDAAQLLPSNLAVTKVQHAWERRPQSPFTRRRLKVGKVWKRAGGLAAPSSSMFSFGGSSATIRPESPLRAVKKMRGAAGEHIARDWDVRGSPRNRRIVTRSTRGEDEEDLVELAEEDAEDSGHFDEGSLREEVVRVEIEHEDGTIVELDAEEGAAEVENENWDDESMTDEDEAAYDATLMHLAETIGQPQGAQEIEQQYDLQQADGQQLADEEMEPVKLLDHPVPLQEEAIVTEEINDAHSDGLHESKEPLEPVVDARSPWSDTTPAEHANAEVAPQSLESPAKQVKDTPPARQLKSALKQHSQFGAIPEGFVSPVKERQRRTINQVRLSNANRRRTLPVNFAAQQAAAIPNTAKDDSVEEAPLDEATTSGTSPTVAKAGDLLIIPSESVSNAASQASLTDGQSEINLDILPSDSQTVHAEEVLVDEAHDENAWEDIDENIPDDDAEDELEAYEKAKRKQYEVEATPEVVPSHEERVEGSEEIDMSEDAASKSPIELETSPVRTTAGQHPRLPLRRSPRRQSTSPIKRSGILPSSTSSHLVAFTPIKLPAHSSATDLQGSHTPDTAANNAMNIDNSSTVLQASESSSAPSGKPQLSPRRPRQPRLSDDEKAFLMGFIKRTNESKTSKDGTTIAKRESIENRRDSSSVRQALASPGPSATTVAGDVLADLDPNSPSPRKQALAASLAQAAQTSGKSAAEQDEDELALSATPTKRTSSRKSGRVKKKSEVLPATTYNASAAAVAGPNRISIRGTDSVIVLKKTEAQEIAQMTKNNTRKNKSGAVMPYTRLAKLKEMMSHDEIAPPDDDQMDIDVRNKKPGRRAVKWAETLESFHEGANEPEMSMLSDELNESAESQQSESVMPPASETPSKPSRLRRLRTPRPTASSSASTKAATAEAAVSAAPASADTADPPKVKKRSSRIATPAKLPGAAKSLLPEGLMDVDGPPPAAPVSTSKKAPITRKKVPSSKLPAPSSLTAAAAGKENSLIASPPKKRTTSRSAGATSNVPKLDFAGSKTVLEPAVGLAASPAKKGATRAQVFFKENGDVSVSRNEAPVLGLTSPAKKRPRRL